MPIIISGTTYQQNCSCFCCRETVLMRTCTRAKIRLYKANVFKSCCFLRSYKSSKLILSFSSTLSLSVKIVSIGVKLLEIIFNMPLRIWPLAFCKAFGLWHFVRHLAFGILCAALLLCPTQLGRCAAASFIIQHFNFMGAFCKLHCIGICRGRLVYPTIFHGAVIH